VGALASVAMAASVSACADQFDTTRSPPPRGTVGEELYGVLCDRVGAQALHEDLTGASYRGICHKDATGQWATKVDQTALPGSDPNAIDVNGQPVTVAAQDANRQHAVARIEAMGRRRADLVASLDAAFPAISVPVKDASCSSAGSDKLSNQLTALLGRFQGLYDDGTIPQSTESLARVFDAIKSAPDAQSSFARFEARQGYRPIDVALGAARPVIAWDGLRDLLNSSLALLASDSQPYAVDSSGNHQVIPGPANPQFNQLIQVSHHEMLYATPDPSPGPLLIASDSGIGRTLLSRPRTDLEVLGTLFYAQGSAFGNAGAKPSFIVRRDARGYAQVHAPGGVVPGPFVDADHDGLADVDDLGRFVTTDGQPPASPFFFPGLALGNRDQCGRALGGAPATGATDAGSGSEAGATDAGPAPVGNPCGNVTPDDLLYEYLDTSHVFATRLMNDLKPLANPDASAKHETLMYALAGAPLLLGSRDGGPKTQKCYAPDPKDPSNCSDPASLLAYDSFETDSSALLDLVYAVGQMLGDPTIDDTLAFTSQLFTSSVGDVARLAGDGLAMKASANQHTEAKIPPTSTFWDEMLDVTVQLEKEPGLLEDVLRSLGADGTQNLGQIFANYMQFDDRVTYDPNHLNGPPLNKSLGNNAEMNTPVDRTQPDTGFNRSAMQRFLSLVHDTNGVTACNKPGAVVHTHGINLPLIGNPDLPLGGGSYQECEVFKIENLAKFYLDAIVGKGSLYFRPNIMRTGILGFGAATVDVIDQSSGIGYEYNGPTDGNGTSTNDTTGFWDPPSAKTFRPRPQWLDRLVFFDQKTNTNTTDKYYITQHFLADLNGPHIGSSVCPERQNVPDPCANASNSNCGGAPDASSDGLVHGLRNCPDGDWLDQRGADTIFVWEQFGFYQAITPLLSAFVNHGREDLFIQLMDVMYRHWADGNGTPQECLLSSDPKAQYQQCSKDGVVTYEPLLVDDFGGDILPALHDFEKTLEATTIQHCATLDPTTHQCTAAQKMDGIAVLAAATRALVDPDQATAAGLKDRHGAVTGQRNDGTTNPQVTPVYLLTQALNAMDAAFANDPAKGTPDDRLAQWRLARSQLVDQFLAVDGTTTSSTFHNPAIPQITPVLIDLLRAQLLARCPTSFSAPNDRCTWARDTLTQQMTNVIHGPTFGATMDVLEAIRTDPNSRRQLGNLLQYLLNAASDNDALPSVLASANDMIQLLEDDTNLVPVYHAIAPALDHQPGQKSVVDAQLALLGKISGRALDGAGKESCGPELDPNQVLNIALKNLVTPMQAPDGTTTQTPLQIIMDVIGDVNRADPSQTSKFAGADYASIADNVSDFLLNKERGLEQFYEIVRQGTVNQ
jgi:hypothetical protein